MNRGPAVDIIVLNFNQEKDALECISSLKDMTYRNYRVVLVDNGSTDGSGLRIKEKFADIELLRSEKNLGFAAGVNLGINYSLKEGLADYILLLNNDTKVDKNLLSALSEAIETDKRIGIAGAVNFYYSRPDEVHMAGHRFIWWLGVQGRVTKIEDKFKGAQSVSACCMLIRKEAINNIGLFDERFFIYYEDSDFCLRARRAGFKVITVKEAKVWHKINKVLGSRTPMEYYIYTRNQPLFMLKNCPRIFIPNYFIVYFLKVSIRIIYFFATGRISVSRAVFRGLVDFFAGNFGRGRLFE